MAKKILIRIVPSIYYCILAPLKKGLLNIRMQYIRYTLFLTFLFSFAGCNNEENLNKPLVSIGDRMLRKEQLMDVLPKGLSEEDSLQFAEHFIKKWITDELLYEQAGKNIVSNKEIEQKVEEYKRSLILYSYLNGLMAERLNQPVPENEIKTYYDTNDMGLYLEESIIKGFMLKVPINATDLNKLKGWCMEEATGKSVSTENIADIENYCLRNASIYEYFYDRWEPLHKYTEMMPVQFPDNEEEFLKATPFIEIADSSFYYFLNIKSYLSTSDKQPYEFARKTITDILVNQRRNDFIQQIGNDLYQEAIEKDKVKIYY
ncbi:MAG: hypothetical protein LUG18_12015 [Candidatus Azobacteroides sp.]|nr:hypothetical protein [Candidatus Azobacteroides sp.]